MDIAFIICNSIPVAIVLTIWFVQACIGLKLYSRHLLYSLSATEICYVISVIFIWKNKIQVPLETCILLLQIGSILQVIYAFFMCRFTIGTKLDYEQEVNKYEELNERYKELYAKYSPL